MSDNREGKFVEDQANFRRIARYVLGIVIACAMAFGIGWGLSFILPVFLAKFLTDYSTSNRVLFTQLVMAMVFTVLIGMLISLGGSHYPVILLLLVGLLMFWTYYLFLDPKWNFFATILMIAVMLLPYLGTTHPALIFYVGQGLTVSGLAAVIGFVVLHGLVPERKERADLSGAPPSNCALSPEQRVREAFNALLIAYPVVVFFYYFKIDGAILTMVFIGILSLQITAVKSFKVSIFLLLTNGIGGLLAVLLYELLVTVPHFLFLISLITLVSLVIGARIYLQPLQAPVWAGIMSAMLVVLGGAITSDNKLIEVSFYSRIAQIILASFYMIAVSMLIDLWRMYYGTQCSTSGKIN